MNTPSVHAKPQATTPLIAPAEIPEHHLPRAPDDFVWSQRAIEQEGPGKVTREVPIALSLSTHFRPGDLLFALLQFLLRHIEDEP
jgi:hypothetical protein